MHTNTLRIRVYHYVHIQINIQNLFMLTHVKLDTDTHQIRYTQNLPLCAPTNKHKKYLYVYTYAKIDTTHIHAKTKIYPNYTYRPLRK